jgi:hypothetical protein
MVTAAQVGHRRNLEFNGQPTGEQFFSTHRAGLRKPVKHVMKNKWFFAFIEGGDQSDGGGGESLQHILFKEALKDLQHLKLSLYNSSKDGPKKLRDVQISLNRAEIEMPIHRHGHSPYYADIYIEFESEDLMGMKWDGKLCIEVFNKHAVEAGKQSGLRDIGVAAVEAKIPEIFQIQFEEEDTSDELEDKYRKFVKRILESKNGFLAATILSDPSSKPYLEKLAEDQNRKIISLVGRHNELNSLLSSERDRNEKLTNSLHAEKHARQSANQRLRVIENQLEGAKGALASLEFRRIELEKSVKSLKILNLTLAILLTILTGAVIYIFQ